MNSHSELMTLALSPGRGTNPINLSMKSLILAAILSLSPMTTSATDAVDLLNALNEAVLDWCDAQGGTFQLPSSASPACIIGNEVWAGTLYGVLGEADAEWWWDKRAGLPTGYSFGVLWWIGPTPKNACVVTQGKICQCPPAIAALNNPAQVPVKLIGPGATAC